MTIQPRPTEAGNPDFRVWDGTSRIVGYIEAKPPTEELLDRIDKAPRTEEPDEEQRSRPVLNRRRGGRPPRRP